MICLQSDFALLIGIKLHLLPVSRIAGLVKVAAVVPTEFQKLGSVSSLDLAHNLNRAALVVLTTLWLPEVFIPISPFFIFLTYPHFTQINYSLA